MYRGNRKPLLLPLLAFALFFAGCRSVERPPFPREAEPEPERLAFEVLDYAGKDSGGSVPRWAALYLEGNVAAAEALPEYEDRFVFVAANPGTNMKALTLWQNAFRADLDFARLVTLRIEERFLDAASSYPDDEYGGYFEALVRAASDALWEGAVREEAFWVYRRFPEGDGLAAGEERYDVLILVTIEKEVLIPQIRRLFESVQAPLPLTRDQRAAVSRVQARFFDFF